VTGGRAGFLLVRAGGRGVGLELAHVLEIAQLGVVHPVPAVEPAVRGVVAMQGRTTPVVHLGALLEGASHPTEPGGVGVLVAVNGRRLCLEVDEAETLSQETALPVPPGEAMPYAIGVARHGDVLVPLLDLTALSSRLMESSST
jgi:chemotaxis signal transduction protein